MPTYRYACEDCGKEFERTESITEHQAAEIHCPKCRSKNVSWIPGRFFAVTSKKS